MKSYTILKAHYLHAKLSVFLHFIFICAYLKDIKCLLVLFINAAKKIQGSFIQTKDLFLLEILGTRLLNI